MNISNLDKLFFAIIGLFALCIKGFYSLASLSQLRFILAPTNFLVELFVNQKAIYEVEKGYVYAVFNIVIDKFCAGINFWLIAFLAFFFALYTKYQTFYARSILLITLCLFSFCLTIFTNASRIIVAIRLQKLPFEFLKTIWFHEALGAFMYLSVLLFFYVILTKKNYLKT
jgi:exosortase K